MKTICIYHSRDLDGWMSAAIVKKWFLEQYTDGFVVNFNEPVPENINELPYLTMLGWDYGDKIPDLSSYGKVIMVDVAFIKGDDASEMYKLISKLIWIDHHASAIKTMKEYMLNNSRTLNSLTCFLDTTLAACELTWKYYFPDKKMPEIVRLLGRYDCFGHKGTDEDQKVLEFQYAARARISNYEDAYKHLLSDTPIGDGFYSVLIKDMLNEGKAIYKYLCAEAQQTYKKAFPVEFTEDVYLPNHHDQYPTQFPRKFLCVNQERFNPINFGIDYHKEGYDGFACFWYKNKKWHWSLYNDNGKVDCSVIAKQLGGGGHKGAAGMVVDDLSIARLLNLMIK